MENITLGQKRVQRNFNLSANSAIEELKEDYAKLIDKVGFIGNSKNGREIVLAHTQLETSYMYAVKSLFI